MDVRYKKNITILILLGIFSGLLFSCSLKGKRPAYPKAERGVLDLSRWNFEEGGAVPLSGEWELYWKRFIPPVSGPETVDSVPLYSYVPKGWGEAARALDPSIKDPHFGYGSYRLTVLLPPGMRHIGLRLPQQYSAYVLYVDGEETASNGVVAGTPEKYRGSWIPAATFISDKDSRLDLVLHIANYTMNAGGFFYPIRIGPEARIATDYRLEYGYEVFVCGGLVVLWIYYVFFSFFQKWDRPSLLLSLACLLYALRIMTHGEILLVHIVPVGLELLNKIRFLTLYLIPPTVVFFLLRFFSLSEKSFIAAGRIFAAVCFAFSYFVLVTPVRVYVQTLDYFPLLLGITVSISLVCLAAAVRKGNSEVWAVLFGLLLITITGSIDYYAAYNRLWGYGFTSPIGFLVFALLIALVLGKRFAVTLTTEKIFSREQTRLTETLEQRVSERTRELTEANSRLSFAVEESNKANTAKTDFLAMMSHEIRTPLNAVVGMSELLGAGPLSEKQSEYLDILRNSTDNLLVVIDDILDFSRLESGRLAIEELETDLPGVIKEIIGIYLPAARKKGLYLVGSIGDDVPRGIKTDPHRLKQILGNLISNALKFTSAGGIAIKVENLTGVSRPDRRRGLRFSVEDTGIGIPRDKLRRVFGSFEQADSSISRKYGGTGLGLAISKRLAGLLGGTIWVESTLGTGSTFYFSILADWCDIDHPAREASLRFESPRPAGLKVLLVEDNAANIIVAETHMTALGWACRVAESGREAIDLLAREPFDLVFMDLEMPELDGMETSRRLRGGEAGEAGRKTPIVAMTAHALEHYRQKAFDSGMNGYLTKPVTRASILKAVQGFFPTGAGTPGFPNLNLPAAMDKFEGNEVFLKDLYKTFSEDITLLLTGFNNYIKAGDYKAVARLALSVLTDVRLLEIHFLEVPARALHDSVLEKNKEACERNFIALEPALLVLREEIEMYRRT
jgi:signal transduction histidine kinase/ActR/RegA family two-component response regulator